MRAWAAERNKGNLQAANAYASGTAPFQSRAAQTVLVGAFLTGFYALVAEWAEWAQQQVADWPDDPRQAQPDPAAFIDVLRTAGWSEP